VRSDNAKGAPGLFFQPKDERSRDVDKELAGKIGKYCLIPEYHQFDLSIYANDLFQTSFKMDHAGLVMAKHSNAPTTLRYVCNPEPALER